MTTFATPNQTIPGYLTGTWDLDPSHSSAPFPDALSRYFFAM